MLLSLLFFICCVALVVCFRVVLVDLFVLRFFCTRIHERRGLIFALFAPLVACFCLLFLFLFGRAKAGAFLVREDSARWPRL